LSRPLIDESVAMATISAACSGSDEAGVASSVVLLSSVMLLCSSDMPRVLGWSPL
jgi:hypothetical protein